MEISTSMRRFDRARGRARWLGLLGIAAAGIVGCSQAVGSPSAWAEETPSTSGSARATQQASASPAGAGLRLLVLGGADSDSYSLWTYDSHNGWEKLEAGGEATAVGRNATTVALARAGGIATRPLQGFEAAEDGDGPGWTPVPPAAEVVSVALSPSGRSAAVVLDGSSATYMVQDGSGRLATLSPAPRQPFSPQVAWLDDNRIAALSVDDLLVSHLCVIDPAAQKPNLLTGLTGVRVFAVSPGGSTIAAATEAAVYVGPASTWLANKPGDVAVAVPDQTVVWDLALDLSGTRLAFMSGTLGADGTVTDRRTSAFELTPSGWQKMFEADLPFAAAGGQIWLS